jgi:hypothetical protein
MISPQKDRSWSPSPEELAAYADGELDRCSSGAVLKQHIEIWLADHPEGVFQVESLGQLARLFKNTAADEPGEQKWSDLASRIKTKFLETPPPPRRKKRKAWWAAAFLASAAAAVLLAFQAIPRSEAPPKRDPVHSAPVEPFPVASADEVEILRVEGSDTPALVVGQPPVSGLLLLAVPGEVEILQVNGEDTDSLVVGQLPVRGPLEMAQPGDVIVKKVEATRDHNKPEITANGENPPVVWAPQPTQGNE